MAEIDELSIGIEASAEKANKAIDSLIDGLGKLADSLKIDTSGLEKIGSSIKIDGIEKASRQIQSKMSGATKSLEIFNAKYKDLGKGFTLKGSTEYISKQIDSLTNQLAKAKLAKEDFERSGKTDSVGYETAVKNVIKLTNQIESLNKEISEQKELKISVNTKEIEHTEELIEQMKNHIRQQMEGVRIENPIDVWRLSAEDFQTFKRLQTEMAQVGTAADIMGEKIEQNLSPLTEKRFDENLSSAVFGEMASGVENWSQAVQQFGTNAGAVLNQSSTETDELNAKTKQFEESLKSLKIPPINTNNLETLKKQLQKTEEDHEKLKTKLENGITMGKISANVDDKAFRDLKEQMSLAEKQAEALRGKIQQLEKTSNSTASGAKNLSNSVKSATGSISNLSTSSTKAIAPLNNLGSGFKRLVRTMLPIIGITQLFRFGKNAMETASDLTEVQNVVDTTFGNMADKVDKLSEHSITDFGMSELTAKQISSRFQAMGTAMGFTQEKMSDMSIELTKLAADMASFYNVEQADVAKSLQSVFTGTTAPLRQYGIDLTQATLQEWALKQGLDADIKSMSQAEKTMLRYHYVLANTTAAQGDFARTADTWANSVRILKQNFEQLASVIGGTLVNVFKPIVKAANAAMSAIISFAKTISNALGKIFGWTYEVSSGGIVQDFSDVGEFASGGGGGASGATDNLADNADKIADSFDNAASASDDIADSTGQAKKNIDKMKAGLRAFDELKTISIPALQDDEGNDKLSNIKDKIKPWKDLNDLDDMLSGGAGGLGGAGGGGGKWVPGESILKKFESEIDSLYELGAYIGKTLTDAMNSIDWDAIYGKARNFGKGLADFLNGLISPDLFGALGRTIAGSLNTALYALQSFGETFDWKDFGLSIATGINEFFATYDFAALAHTLNTWAIGILDTAIEAIDNTDWDLIGEKIGEFLAEINFLEIGYKIGKLIWKAINAGFEFYIGMFEKAPLETALISLIAMPKLLKTITSSKIIKGLKKLSDNIKLVVTALAGNKTASVLLIDQYPKLGKAVDTARTAFANFRFGIENGNIFTGLSEGIKVIRDNLTGLQKGAITAVAGFAEFKIVSSTFEGLTLGTEDLLSSIGKIAGVVAAAAGAMYVALGPAGLAIAAITGLVAGIVGVETAMQQINAETIGNTIRNALENPGGVSMDEIAGAFNEKMSSIASSFDNISQHSQALEAAQTNIKNTYTEISAIETAMNNGTISVEDGVKRINEAFSGLSTNFNDAITALEQGIIGALGEGSILRQYLAAMGYDVEALNGIVVGDVTNIQKEFDKLTAEYESIKESTNPEDISRKEEIIRTMTAISGVFDETSQNMTAFKTSVENMHLNMGSVIDTEGITFKKEEFGNSLQSMVDAYTSASGSIAQGNETFQNNLATLSNMLKAAGIEENTATYSEIMSKIPEITNSADSDLKEAFNGIIETIQQDALNEIPTLIDQASAEWENLDFDTKTKLNYQGITNKDAYIASVVESYKRDVLSPMEEQINSALESLNIDEDGIMVQKAQELYDSLFYYDYKWDLGGGERTFKMRGNWEQILEEADLPSISEEYGETTVSSFNSGVSDMLSTAVETVNKLMSAVDQQGFHDSDMIFGSPSKKAIEYGKWTVEGFNTGITGNTQSTISTVSSYINKIKQTFSGIVSVFEEIGKMVMQGFEGGMSQMEGGLYDKANSIADNITKTIKSALEIHSPSRVMFELGDYTMQGFKEGIESLYNPITDSIKAFSYGVSVAPAPSLTDMYGGYQYQPAYTPQYGFSKYPQSGYSQSNSETNALLRQILSAIREGKTITIGQDEVGRASVRYIQGEERRLQKSLVGIY